MLQEQQGTGAGTTMSPSQPSAPQFLHAGEAEDQRTSHGAALAASTLEWSGRDRAAHTRVRGNLGRADRQEQDSCSLPLPAFVMGFDRL